MNVLFLQLIALVALVVIDLVATVAWAIYKGAFDWEKLLCFLRKNVVPYVLIWGVLAAIKWAAEDFGIQIEVVTAFLVFIDIIYAAIVAKLAHSILTTFKDLGIAGADDALQQPTGGTGATPNAGK